MATLELRCSLRIQNEEGRFVFAVSFIAAPDTTKDRLLLACRTDTGKWPMALLVGEGDGLGELSK